MSEVIRKLEKALVGLEKAFSASQVRAVGSMTGAKVVPAHYDTGPPELNHPPLKGSYRSSSTKGGRLTYEDPEAKGGYTTTAKVKAIHRAGGRQDGIHGHAVVEDASGMTHNVWLRENHRDELKASGANHQVHHQ